MKLVSKFTKSKGLIQSSMVALGNVGASGFSAVSLIILSRFLGPENFGAFSVAFALSQLVARFGDLGLSIGMQRLVAANYKTDPDKAASTIRFVGLLKLGLAIIAIVVGLLLGPIIGTTLFGLSNPSVATLGIVMASAIIGYEFVVVILQSISSFGKSVVVNAAQAVTKLILAIVGIWVLSPNAFTSYLWYGLAPLVAVVMGWMFIPSYLKKTTANESTIKKPLFDTVRFSSIAVIAAAIGDNIDVLMVKSWLTEYETGLYSAAARVALMVTLVGLSFGTVFNTRVAQYKNQQHLTKFLKKALPFAIGSVVLIPVTFLLAKPLILITAGSQFIDAVSSMNMLMAGALVTMAMMPYVAIFYAVDYPKYFAISGVLQTIILVLSNVLLIPQFGIEGAALAKLLTRTIVALYTIGIALHVANKQYLAKSPSLVDIKKWVHHAFRT